MTEIDPASMTSLNISRNEDSRGEIWEIKDPVISNEALRVLAITFYGFFSGVVSFLGITANVINIIIFFKQGFNDSINISLCGLAIADLCSLLPLLWMSICYSPLFQNYIARCKSTTTQYLTGAWPHACFVWITSWITVFITFERCVCITLPMNVKDIMTPKRTLITVAIIFVVMIGCCLPQIFSFNTVTLFDTHYNKTMSELPFLIRNVLFLVQSAYSINIIEQVSSVFIVFILTTTLIVHLQAKSHWRFKNTGVSSSFKKLNIISQRDKKVMLMVTFISCIFVVCYLPTAVNCLLAVILSPDYDSRGRYSNVFRASWAIITPVESINSAVTIIIYYKMSSRFKATFNELFKSVLITVNSKICEL